MSTETTRLIRDGEKGREEGVEGVMEITITITIYLINPNGLIN